MLLQVGNKLGEYIIAQIGETSYVQVARDSSSDWSKSELARQVNVTYLHTEIDNYEVGDVIQVDEVRVRLEKEGDVYYFIPMRKVRRLNGSDGCVKSAQAQANEAEGVGRGSEGGEGLGGESVGEDDRPTD